MARVTGDFQSDVIRAYKGVLDFYYWRGIGVVRSWPRKPVLPRNPAVQAAGIDWRDNSRALSSLPLALQIATAEEVRDTAYTWKDAWTTTAYGKGLTWTQANANRPFAQENEKAMQVNLVQSPTDASSTFNVNNANYMTAWSKVFLVPFSSVPFTHYRLAASAQSNAAGQSVSCQIAEENAPATAQHAPGPDFVVNNTFQRWDSGWRSIDNIPAVDQFWCVAFKGSNGTVDINLQMLQVTLAVF